MVILLTGGMGVRTVADVVGRTSAAVRGRARSWNRIGPGSVHTGHAGGLDVSLFIARQCEGSWACCLVRCRDKGCPLVPRIVSCCAWRARRSITRPRSVGDSVRAGSDVLVVVADGARIECGAVLRRSWCVQSIRVRIGIDRGRKSQDCIGSLHRDDESVGLVRLDRYGHLRRLRCSDRSDLEHPEENIVVVWDDAGWRKFMELEEELGTVKNPGTSPPGRSTPPCGPDENPVEHVWEEAGDSSGDHQRAAFKRARTAFETFITSNESPYRRTRQSC